MEETKERKWIQKEICINANTVTLKSFIDERNKKTFAKKVKDFISAGYKFEDIL